MPARCSENTFNRFEKQNPAYALTVFECSAKSTVRDGLQPAYVSDDDEGRERITLILLYNPAEGETRSTPATTTSR